MRQTGTCSPLHNDFSGYLCKAPVSDSFRLMYSTFRRTKSEPFYSLLLHSNNYGKSSQFCSRFHSTRTVKKLSSPYNTNQVITTIICAQDI